MRRFIYTLLSIFNTGEAASKGSKPFVKHMVRREAHRSLASVLRRILR